MPKIGTFKRTKNGHANMPKESAFVVVRISAAMTRSKLMTVGEALILADDHWVASSLVMERDCKTALRVLADRVRELESRLEESGLAPQRKKSPEVKP